MKIVVINIIWSILFISLLIVKNNTEIKLNNKEKELLKKQIELDSVKTKLDFCNGINY